MHKQHAIACATVPGTSANLGPGYDCLGIALDLYNTVTVETGAGSSPPHPMADEAIAAFYAATSLTPEAVTWRISGDVPSSRGLGSSVTLRLGLLAALNHLHGAPLSAEDLYRLCTRLEGHPDNAAPAQFGGFVVALPDRHFIRFEVEPRLRFVLLIPNFEVQTSEARRVLPDSVPRADAVANLALASLMTAAFATRDYRMLRHALHDMLHQPYRKPLLPFMDDVVAAGIQAGALGGFLSGSGSAICCLTLDSPGMVAEAMRGASGLPDSRTVITSASNKGLCVHAPPSA